MIGSAIIGASLFSVFNSIYSVVFDVLIKNLVGLLTKRFMRSLKIHKRRSNKIYNFELTMTKI